MFADFALGLGVLALLLAGLVLFARWVADAITGWLDRAVRTDTLNVHSTWKGNGA